tara:strand:+ start:1201 stop:2433 length:1233 start_codon:yes stop_codon:yes gene_type:complete
MANLNILEPNHNFIYNLFSSFYENCSIHDLSYTFKILKKELDEETYSSIIIDEYYNVKSGSIAQVYKAKYKNKDVAIKIVHPDIKYQAIYPILFFKVYNYITSNISFFYKFSIIFLLDTFFCNLIDQFDLIKEYNNMKYFYHEYLDNEYILIPEPIMCTKNILIMSYIEGNSINNITVSFNNKYKIICLLSSFLKDNYFNQSYFHSDLHDSNWKIIPYKNFYKIIIYDYGYISKNTKEYQELFKNIIFKNDTFDIYGLMEILYEFCYNIKIDKNNFINNFKKYLEDEQLIVEPFSNESMQCAVIYLYKKKIQLDSKVFELFISSLLFRKYLLEYLGAYNITNYNDSNGAINTAINHLDFCKQLNIFHKLIKYYKTRYIDNPILMKKYHYNDLYLDNLEKEGLLKSTSVDI